MTTNQTIHTWEKPLIGLAYKALEQHASEHHLHDAGQADMRIAYRRCSEITREHSKTFYLASGLLPGEKRQAARALYAFCRISDDLVDRAQADPVAELAAWRQRTLGGKPSERSDAIALAWAHTRRRFGIPWLYAEQLLQGVAQDLVKQRYATFDELAQYCYGVACTVGLMSMHIIGYQGREAFPYAIRLGVALQMTNILRDVGEDWRSGRVYLPQEELAEFGLSEADLAAGKVSPRWRAFMFFQIERNRQLYADAMPGIDLLNRDGRFAIAAAAELYRAILDQIEANDYDVFRYRANVRWGEKLSRLPGIWLRATSGHYSQAADEKFR